jgi:hypothetical protein
MAVLQSTPRCAAWLLVVSALCIHCAKVSPTDPATRHDAGIDLDLSSRDLTTTHDGMPAAGTTRDLATARVNDLARPADLASTDMAGFTRGAFYQVSSKLTGQLISVHGAATSDGSAIEQQPAHGGADQRWTLTAATTPGAYQLINVASQTCLDVNGASTADSATVWIWTCGTVTSQAWTLKDAGGGFYSIVNVNSGSCLDLDHANTAPGTAIFQYRCNGGDNQSWFFTRLP